jgi:osmotically-inducible protein OsmY
MKGSGTLLSGVLLGAGAMYVLDPDRGTRRRSLIRDKGIRASRKLSEGVGATARDLRNRSTGTAAALASRMKRDQAADEIVQERVRAALGRVASHPGAIEASVYNRRVILRGAVPAGEVNPILNSISRVRGVSEVENQLEAYEDTSSVPSLQGPGRPPIGRTRLSPTGRLFLGTLGTAATIAGMKSRGSLARVSSAIGLGVLAQAVLNLSIGRQSRREPSESSGARVPPAPAESSAFSPE